MKRPKKRATETKNTLNIGNLLDSAKHTMQSVDTTRTNRCDALVLIFFRLLCAFDFRSCWDGLDLGGVFFPPPPPMVRRSSFFGGTSFKSSTSSTLFSSSSPSASSSSPPRHRRPQHRHLQPRRHLLLLRHHHHLLLPPHHRPRPRLPLHRHLFLNLFCFSLLLLTSTNRGLVVLGNSLDGYRSRLARGSSLHRQQPPSLPPTCEVPPPISS